MAERDELLGRFRSGDLRCLANVYVLTTGFDTPNIDCVALLRPTMSPGLFLCAPTPGYRLTQGAFAQIPVLTEKERDSLLEAAWALNEHMPEPADVEPACSPASDRRPGDDHNDRGGLRELLIRHGWTLAQAGENECWRRPGKTSGWSATLRNRVFYVFSSNASPFEPQRAYSPFSVYALLEHGGDYEQAARSLRQSGYGGHGAVETSSDVDLSGILGRIERPPPGAGGPPDPGPFPEELLRVPGFVSEVMDHCVANGHKLEWADITRDLTTLQYAEVAQDGKRFLRRSEAQGTFGRAFAAAGVALPPTVQQIEVL